ncbi:MULTISPECIES: hypothetical protein [Vibrio]|uniref:hypothetical protein n=1 Tax=Vibrio TaxID=662 RepID=UPI0011DB1687|nr:MULTISPECIES: hypothetical protein [Vibrio]CAH1546168.1 conserved hypothetical protein [Vibrio rotiferianus]MCC3785948.1 hypothetical protein [Vibrio parahaemolyticus]MCC3837829.1 hypothetical protein [Vibrio parahaemolyticus]TXZ07663.1 hypothetical protein FXE63_10085 [Vibrio mimicus]TXZ07692.1 hypothetical protein FXE63_10030 [Vibrio mimicus]
MSIDLSVVLSIWGAVVSTGLAFLKIKEVYNNRFKVGTSYVFRSDAEYGNEISIQNLSNTPILLNYMEVYYRPKGLLSWFEAPKQLWSPEDEMLNDRIEPHSGVTFPFAHGDHFTWENRKIYVRLYFAGKKAFEKRVDK